MKKIVLLLVLLISVSVLLTACTPRKGSDGLSGVNQEENLKGSLFDLVKLGKNIRCTYSSSGESGESSGSTFVSGNKARSDFTATTNDGKKFESYSITDGDWIYIWTSQSDQGTKMKISEVTANENKPDTSKLGEVNSAFDYKCSPWIPDSSKFILPTNVTFVDFTETMKNLQEQADKMKEGLKGMCGTCDLAGSPEKIAKCKESLGCE